MVADIPANEKLGIRIYMTNFNGDRIYWNATGGDASGQAYVDVTQQVQ